MPSATCPLSDAKFSHHWWPRPVISDDQGLSSVMTKKMTFGKLIFLLAIFDLSIGVIQTPSQERFFATSWRKFCYITMPQFFPREGQNSVVRTQFIFHATLFYIPSLEVYIPTPAIYIPSLGYRIWYDTSDLLSPDATGWQLLGFPLGGLKGAQFITHNS